MDGGWGPWGACPKACSNQEQSRTCNQPQPSNGGRTCAGSARKACGARAGACDPCPDVSEYTTCVLGQGKVGIHSFFAESKAHSRNGCETFCRWSFGCMSFDFATSSAVAHGACRLYRHRDRPRLGSSTDGRQYCTLAGERDISLCLVFAPPRTSLATSNYLIAIDIFLRGIKSSEFHFLSHAWIGIRDPYA